MTQTSTNAAGARASTRPKVAVLIPTANRPRQLAVALRSVLAQHTDAELDVVVAADGEQPESAEVVARADDDRVRYLELPASPGRGYATLHLAAQTIDAAYVAYCEDDDLWLPTHLSQLLVAADNDPSVLAFSRPCRVRADAAVVAPFVDSSLFGLRDPDAFALQLMPVPITAVLHSTDDLDRIGGWPIEFASGAPQVVWQRMLDAGTPVRLVPWATALHFAAEERGTVPDAERAAELAGYWTMDAAAIAAFHNRVERTTQTEFVSRLRAAQTEAASAASQLEAVQIEAREAISRAGDEIKHWEGERNHWHNEVAAMRATNWWRLGERLVPRARKATNALLGR